MLVAHDLDEIPMAQLARTRGVSVFTTYKWRVRAIAELRAAFARLEARGDGAVTGPGESAGPWPRELQERSTRRRRSRDRRASTLALFLAGLLLLLRRPTAAMEPSDDMVPFDLLGLAILFLTLVVPVVAVTFRMLERPEDRVD